MATTHDLSAGPRAAVRRNAPTPPQQERSRRTRAHILHMAAMTFAEVDYPAVTLQDVADRAEMTKGAVYFHFGNKEALALAVVEAHINHWQPLEDSVRALRLSPLETMLTVLDRTADAFANNVMVQAGARLQLQRSLIKAELPRPYVGWQHRLALLATAAKNAGQLSPDTDPAVLARVFVSAFFGMQHISDMLMHRSDLIERYIEMRDTVLRSFIV
jgi:AcrR family transcriptional regulator